MVTKIVIIGASHAGHEAAIDILDRYSNVQVDVYEADDFVSFMSCGMKLFLEGKTTAQDNVRNFFPQELEEIGAHVHNNSRVVNLDPDKKEITVEDPQGSHQVSYDKLILTVGSLAKSIDGPGKDLDNILLMRGHYWASRINEALHDPSIKNVTVIGAGNGVSAAEVMAKAGKNVTLIDKLSRPLQFFLNPMMISLVEDEFRENNVKMMMGTTVTGFEGRDGKVSAVITDQGNIPTDLVIQTVGIKPNTEWLKGVIDLNDYGYIETDNNFKTNQEDVYAIGDAILAFSIPANNLIPAPSAVAARHEAKYLSEHIFEETPATTFPGLVGAQVLDLFSLHGFTTGINSNGAGRSGIIVETDYYEDYMRPRYIPEKDNPIINISLTYNLYSHQLLGADVISTHPIDEVGNVFTLAIGKKMTLEELADQDFFFSPSYDKQWNFINLAAQHALDMRDFD